MCKKGPFNFIFTCRWTEARQGHRQLQRRLTHEKPSSDSSVGYNEWNDVAFRVLWCGYTFLCIWLLLFQELSQPNWLIQNASCQRKTSGSTWRVLKRQLFGTKRTARLIHHKSREVKSYIIFIKYGYLHCFFCNKWGWSKNGVVSVITTVTFFELPFLFLWILTFSQYEASFLDQQHIDYKKIFKESRCIYIFMILPPPSRVQILYDDLGGLKASFAKSLQKRQMQAEQEVWRMVSQYCIDYVN